MFDLQHLAFQGDITRVTTFMYGAEQRGPDVSGDRPERIAPRDVAPRRQPGEPGEVRQVVHLARRAVRVSASRRCGNTPDGDGTLLDHSLLMIGGGMSNGNIHSHMDVPIALVGGADRLQGQPARGDDRWARRCRTCSLDRGEPVGRARSTASATAPGRSISTPHHGTPSRHRPHSALSERRPRRRGGCCRGTVRRTGTVRRERSTVQTGFALVALAAAPLHCVDGLRGRQVPLVEAVEGGDAATVRVLLKQPNAANVADADGTTPLHVATDLDDLATAQAARARRRQRQGRQPLRRHAAVFGGRQRQRRDDRAAARTPAPIPTPRCREGETALMTAARTGKVDGHAGAAGARRQR